MAPASFSTIDSSSLCQPFSSFVEIASSPVPVHVKDASKRKRVNRSAKLKQCKLDARREQWLSQGKHGKAQHCDGARTSISLVDQQNVDDPGELVDPADHGNTGTSLRGVPVNQNMGSSGGRLTARSHFIIEHQDHEQDEGLAKENLEVRSCMSECSEVGSSPKSCGSQSPDNKIIKWGKEDTGRFSNEISFNKIQPKLGDSQTDNKPNGSEYVDSSSKEDDDDEGLETVDDDWEAAADALEMNCIHDHSSISNEAQNRVEDKVSPIVTATVGSTIVANGRQPPSRTVSQPASGRAWRPDDTCRPSSLPNLNKQTSFPATAWHRIHGDNTREELKSVPSLCPICAEELDKTDSSFEPCSCGFQLCLFCHHRIASDDGRCPGCRKSYGTAFAR